MKIGIIGLGTVGQGVVALLSRHAGLYERRCGRKLSVVAALVRNAKKAREHSAESGAVVTADAEKFFGVASDVVVEVAGGIEPARSYALRAIESGCDVVMANKALLAAHGNEIFAAAEKARRRVLFEAAVAGGVPAIGFLTRGLAANRIESLIGIYNGTCNFILTAMERGGSYADALAEAQKLGFAEADPTLDVSGEDSRAKLAIMATLAFGGAVDVKAIECEGIQRITLEDVQEAARGGKRIRLVACARRRARDDAVELWNGPTIVGAETALGRNMGADMAVVARGDAMKLGVSSGDGAGRFPTASAVVGDILEIARLWELRGEGGLINDWPTGLPASRGVAWDGDVVMGRGGAKMRAMDV